MKQILNGVLKPSLSAKPESVNMSIWKGTTMENTKRKYTALQKRLFTRTTYQAHMEQHTRISATEVTVMMSEFMNAAAKPWRVSALT